jgi:hypothetical protein
MKTVDVKKRLTDKSESSNRTRGIYESYCSKEGLPKVVIASKYMVLDELA